jgi:hypothetical protein
MSTVCLCQQFAGAFTVECGGGCSAFFRQDLGRLLMRQGVISEFDGRIGKGSGVIGCFGLVRFLSPYSSTKSEPQNKGKCRKLSEHHGDFLHGLRSSD